MIIFIFRAQTAQVVRYNGRKGASVPRPRRKKWGLNPGPAFQACADKLLSVPAHLILAGQNQGFKPSCFSINQNSGGRAVAALIYGVSSGA